MIYTWIFCHCFQYSGTIWSPIKRSLPEPTFTQCVYTRVSISLNALFFLYKRVWMFVYVCDYLCSRFYGSCPYDFMSVRCVVWTRGFYRITLPHCDCKQRLKFTTSCIYQMILYSFILTFIIIPLSCFYHYF